MSRLGRAQPVPPIVLVGPFSNTPANVTTAPPILVVENVERRRRYPPLDPFTYGSGWAAVTLDLPPGLLNVENQDRRHRYPSLDPYTYGSAWAAVSQPLPPGLLTVENPDRRHRYPPLDPYTYWSWLAASGQPAGQFFRLFGP